MAVAVTEVGAEVGALAMAVAVAVAVAVADAEADAETRATPERTIVVFRGTISSGAPIGISANSPRRRRLCT